MDMFARYLAVVQELRNRIDPAHPQYADALAYEQRLTDTIAAMRRYGATETRRAERVQIIEQCNDLALATLGQSFNDLCAHSDLFVSNLDMLRAAAPANTMHLPEPPAVHMPVPTTISRAVAVIALSLSLA